MTRRSMIAATVAALSAALVGGCAQHVYQTKGGVGAPTSSRPEVLVYDTGPVPGITVSPRVLDFQRGEKDIEIVWTITQIGNFSGRTFKFASAKGIDFRGEIKLKVVRVDGTGDPKAAAAAGTSAGTSDVTYLDPIQDEVGECKLRAEGREFRCLNKNKRPGLYKYMIRLTDGKDTFVVDPLLENW